MKIVKSALFVSLLVLLVVLAIAFTSGNEAQVAVNYLFGVYQGPVSIAVGVAFLLGFVLAFVVACLLSIPSRLRLRRLTAQLEKANATITKLEADNKTASYTVEKA